MALRRASANPPRAASAFGRALDLVFAPQALTVAAALQTTSLGAEDCACAVGPTVTTRVRETPSVSI
jgi:hypothetical protein